jgi:Dyp-type peroxidase family
MSKTKPKYFDRRAIVPVDPVTDPKAPDLADVQGDVYYMFPKRFERFIFFSIHNLDQFRKDLGTYRPQITTAAKTVQDIKNISNKVAGSDDVVSTEIGFSRAGVTYLGVRDNIGDPHFDQGSMRNEKDLLGDLADYDRVFNEKKIHGVILVTAKKQDTCLAEANTIGKIFSSSVKIEETIEGRVRSDQTEHFGFKDSISQPALTGLCKKHPGQQLVKAGVVLMGYPGDSVFDKPDSIQRPAFTKNGTFMVFRKLEQDVCGFEKYVEDKRGSDNSELFAAKMVGRFKSGAPLALTLRDLPSFTTLNRINEFDYRKESNGCPFSAHIRQNAPRNLDPLISKEFLDAAVIVRAGIPYGNDITQSERNQWTSSTPEQRRKLPKPRGLLFVCYQSCISMGFFLLHTGFANNEFFPNDMAVLKKRGQDALIGGAQPIVRGTAPIRSEGREIHATLTNEDGTRYQITGFAEDFNSQKAIVKGTTPIKRDGLAINGDGPVALKLKNGSKEYELFGFAKEVPSSNVASVATQNLFVTPRGGEYFFIPSISTIDAWAKAA